MSDILSICDTILAKLSSTNEKYSIKRISRDTSISRKTVKCAIRMLERQGRAKKSLRSPEACKKRPVFSA